MEEDYHLKILTEKVIGAAIEVHRILGPGYLESVYEEALAIEFDLRKIVFSRQHIVAVRYKNRSIGEGRLDFLVDNRLVVELKTVETLLPIHTAQVISYLRATDHKLGLLINFNVHMLKQGVKRVILN